jgi:transcriptional regulator of met regulon
MMDSDTKNPPLPNLIRDNPKFYVGEVEAIPIPKSTLPYPRLPFKTCTFELNTIDGKGKFHRIFLFAYEEENTTMVHSFISYKFFGENRDAYINNGYVKVNRETNKYTAFVNMNIVKLLADNPAARHLDNASQMRDSSVKCSMILAHFLAVLNCSNVSVADVSIPEAINKKRRRRDKIPIYSYKILTLKEYKKSPSTTVTQQGTTRLHIRRGHIKHRKTGDFWWNSCMVGDIENGTVIKDYNAEKLLN